MQSVLSPHAGGLHAGSSSVGEHVPSLPAAAHSAHTPPHAVEQHTPSTHVPCAHWALELQLLPSATPSASPVPPDPVSVPGFTPLPGSTLVGSTLSPGFTGPTSALDEFPAFPPVEFVPAAVELLPPVESPPNVVPGTLPLVRPPIPPMKPPRLSPLEPAPVPAVEFVAFEPKLPDSFV